MKQNQNIKSKNTYVLDAINPPKKESNKNIFVKIISVIMTHCNVIGSGGAGGKYTKKKFSRDNRDIRDRIARISQRKNRR